MIDSVPVKSECLPAIKHQAMLAYMLPFKQYSLKTLQIKKLIC